MGFPIERLRRLRDTRAVRRIARETRLAAVELIEPFFVVPARKARRPIAALPGQSQLGFEELLKECAASKAAGIGAVIRFGIPEKKDEQGTGAYSKDGIIPKAIRELKREIPDLYVIADVCMCEYTSHGHCGMVEDGKLLDHT